MGERPRICTDAPCFPGPADWSTVGVPTQKIKTPCGSYNNDAPRIWIKLELAKESPACLEYIVVRELVHLTERRHTGGSVN